jgi:alkylation response protein AidB-like acyl-CoA dehydrogenase
MSRTDVPARARADLDGWRAASSANSFDADHFFRGVLERHLGPRFAELEARFREVAEAAGPELDALVAESNRDENLPTLRRLDSLGREVEEVVFHPSYHVIGQVFWSSGVLSMLSEPGADVATGALSYLLDQHGEAGHACPVSCTAGAIKLIQRLGSDHQRRTYLPGLLESDYRSRLHAAQFVTEIQGGSDVGVNACTATPCADRPGWYRISGDKWFCSVADAGLFVVSARLEGAAEGTGGLGLFLVPRLVDGAPNGFRIERLKTKLGTRSMATGEFTFSGALGEPIGPMDQGFRNLVGIVLDTSRVHNAVAACGIMRRAYVEAQAFAAHRTAFTRRILDYPQIQKTLARMKLRTVTGLATTFRILGMSDRLAVEPDDDGLLAARRISVMINKLWTARAATASARDGIEILGGNGTIEDFSALPRLYRDAIVVESWEGTHNTLIAQVVRDAAVRALHRPWLDHLADEISGLGHPNLEGAAARSRELFAELEDAFDGVLASPESAEVHGGRLVDRMCRLTDWVALLAHAQWVLERYGSGEVLDAVELYRLAELEHADPGERPEIVELRRRLSSGL